MGLYICETIFFDLHLHPLSKQIATRIGEMAEWSNAVVLKTIVRQRTGGSNPSLSAFARRSISCVGLFLYIKPKCEVG